MLSPKALLLPMVCAGWLLALAGCAMMSPPSIEPVALNSPIVVEGLTDVRARADIVSDAVDRLVKYQYRQILKTRGAGAIETRRVDFLAISGGGADGAFAAGFLNGWSESGTRPEFEVVTGVSTGALVAPFAFLGRPYDHKLKRVFTEISDADVYVNKSIFGFLGESLLDPTPLRHMIESILTDDFLDAIGAQERFGRLLLVQTTDIERQVPYIWNITRIAAAAKPIRRKLITDILLASAAIPGVFPPVRFNVILDGRQIEELHVDGGLAAQVFFAPAGLNLRKFETRYFGQPRQQTLYLIRNGKLVPEAIAAETQTFELAKRAISVLIKYQSMEDIYRIQTSFAQTGLVSRIAAIPPHFMLLAKSPFDQDYMRALYATGYDVGRGPMRWTTPR